MAELDSNLSVARPVTSFAGSAEGHRAAIRVVGFCALMTLAAQCRIPVFGTDVPMTLQPLAMLLAGFILSPACAAGSMLLYLAIGTAGVPVFVGGSAGLLGPTGGYLAGFVAGAWMASVLANRSAALGRLVVAGAASTAVLFCLGVGWRFVWLGGDLGLAVKTGLVPFLIKDGVQIALAVVLVRTIRTRCCAADRDSARS